MSANHTTTDRVDVTADDETTALSTSARSWRVVDIVVTAVLGVAIGLVFWLYNGPGYAAYKFMDAVTPGLGGLLNGPWLLAGPLAALVVRKPGAAVIGEVLAASVSAVLGNFWGMSTIYIGLAQGLGAELVFALFAWRRWGLPVTLAAGAGAGVGNWVYQYIFEYYALSATFNMIYLAVTLLSGAVLAGALAWVVTKALANTGVLSRFASGREARAEA